MAISEGTRLFQAEVATGIASGFIDLMARYAATGRRHGHLAGDALEREWVAAVQAMAADVRNAAARDRQHALEAEYRLRRQEPPYHLVRAEIARYARGAEELLVEMVRSDPRAVEALAAALEARLGAARKKEAISE